MIGLGTGQKPDVMIHYPHMMPEDTDVWTKFLNAGTVEIKEVWYDVRVGKQVLVGGVTGDLSNRISAGLTRKRIDVVASVEGGFWVVEVKPYANMYAVGQILSYVRLFSREYITVGEVIPVIVCDDYDTDLIEEFDELGILVIKND